MAQLDKAFGGVVSPEADKQRVWLQTALEGSGAPPRRRQAPSQAANVAVVAPGD